MKEENKDEMKLYIPLNVSTREDFIQGFGKAELIEFLIGFIIVIPISIGIYLLNDKQQIALVVSLFTGFFLCFAITKKEASINMSIIDLIKNFINYQKSQKIFPYRPKKEY